MYSYKLKVAHMVNSWTTLLDGKQIHDTFWHKNKHRFGNSKCVLLVAFGAVLPMTIIFCDVIPIFLYSDNNYIDHSFFAHVSRLCFVFFSIIVFVIILKQIDVISDLYYFSMEIKAICVMITLAFIASLLSLVIDRIIPNSVNNESYYFLIDTLIFILCDFMLIYSATGYIVLKLLYYYDNGDNRKGTNTNGDLAHNKCVDTILVRNNEDALHGSQLSGARGRMFHETHGYVELNVKGNDIYNLKELNFGRHPRAHFTNETSIHLFAS